MITKSRTFYLCMNPISSLDEEPYFYISEFGGPSHNDRITVLEETIKFTVPEHFDPLQASINQHQQQYEDFTKVAMRHLEIIENLKALEYTPDAD